MALSAAYAPLLLLCWFICPAVAAWIEIGAILALDSHPVVGAAVPVAMLGLITGVLLQWPEFPLWARLVGVASTLSAAATGWIFLAGVQALASF